MAEDESDPIKATYDIFIKPSISEDRQVYILQFPNRSHLSNYSKSNNARPTAMRLKHNAGMVEIDVPIDAWQNYDRERGHKWGKSIQKSNMSKAGGSHGLAGGFGIGGVTATARGRRGGGEDDEVDQNAITKDYALAIERGEIFTKQTLGGQYISDDPTTPRYMVGVFRNDQLHLTPVDQVVQMRPQFHHIDARTEQERSLRARENNAGAAPLQARAIHMMVKTKNDGEEALVDTMGERIAAAQDEKWKHHKYVDEDDPEAWQFYGENMLVGAEEKLTETNELIANMPKLESALGDMEFMDTISAPTDPAKMSRSKKSKKKRDRKGKGKEVVGGMDVDGEDDDDESDLSDAPSGGDEEGVGQKV